MGEPDRTAGRENVAVIELFFARTWIAIAAAFIAAVNFVAVWVLWIGIAYWRGSLQEWVKGGRKTSIPDLNSNILIFALVASLLDLIVFGLMDVGQSTAILTSEHLEGIAWLYVAVLVPLVTGKTITKFASSKYGSAESPPPPPQGGGTP